MKQTKEKLKKILPRRTPQTPETGSRRLSTAALRIAGVVLDALPVPGAGAAAHSLLGVVESINVRVRSIIPSLAALFTCYLS